MRAFSVLCLLLLLAGCATFDRVTGRGEAPEPTAMPADTVAVTAAATTDEVKQAAVVLPRDVRIAQTQQGARPPVQGQDAGQASRGGYYPNAPNTPRAYGTTATSPAPYGSPASEASPAYPPSSAPAAAPNTVRPNTTLVATPEAYEHINAVANVTVDPNLAGALTGLWLNTEDPDEVVEFTTDHYSTFYEGELLVTEPMTVHNRCPGDCNGGQPMATPCFTIAGPAGIDCFSIVRLTEQELELQLLGVSSEVVRYRKQ